MLLNTKARAKKLLNTCALFAGIAAAATLSTAPSVEAQQSINSIEVLVNDEPISSFDIDQRLRLVIAISGGVKSEQEFLKVREQVIRSMVDERLQLQEAAELELFIEDEELEGFFARRAQGMNQAPDQLAAALANIGSSKRTMQNQMEAELAWSRLVQGRMGAFVSVSDEEVEAFIQRIYDNKGKFEYRLGEITLLVSSSDQEAAVKANADALVERIKEGANFAQIAQQLSASSSAAVGGDLGWLTADDMTIERRTPVEAANIGDILEPIRTAGGYVILALSDRRRVLTPDPLDAQVSLRQIHLTAEKLTDADAMAKFENYAVSLAGSDTTCGQVAQYAENAGADGATEIGVLRLRDLTGPLRSAIVDLEKDKASELVKLEDGWRVFFVCERAEPQVDEPDFDAIYGQIEQQRLAMMARRYLRDLRRDAIVDYR